MIIKFSKQKLVSGLLAFSLAAVSFGTAYTAPVYAATSDSTTTEETVKDNASSNSLIAGIAAVGLLAVLSHGGGSSSSGNSGQASGSTGAAASGSEEQQAITLLNNDRSANGLPALRTNSQLTSLAEAYAKDMIARGYFSHYNPEGQSPFDRMKQAGISYKSAGENLAVNTNVTTAETAFMSSSGHRANILNASYTDVGIGVVHSPNGSVYVVQEFIQK